MWLEYIVFVPLWFAIFSVGPVFSLVGSYKKNTLVALAGCVLCWVAVVLCYYVSPFAIAFDPPNRAPVLAYAFVSTVGLFLVAFGNLFHHQQK